MNNLELALISGEWEGFRPIPTITNLRGINKPGGAFWTSPAIKKTGNNTYTSDWINWVNIENSGLRFSSDTKFRGVLIDPSAANVFEVKTDEDFALISKEFPETENPILSKLVGPQLNWKEISRHYDGVKVSKSMLYKRSFMAWDVESTAFFSTSNLKVLGIYDIDMVEIKKEVRNG